jgi:aminopeptidase-like protein
MSRNLEEDLRTNAHGTVRPPISDQQGSAGHGVRETLRTLGETVPIRQREYPTGTVCYDWNVPCEWYVREAYIKDSRGRTLVDYRDHPLHLVDYSVPIRKSVTREEMMPHLHTRPDLPDAIPYVTALEREDWGFCLEHRRLAEFTEDRYEVVIDADLTEGFMTIGEGFIQGKSDREILLSTNVWPSMAVSGLSGPIVQTMIYRKLLERPNLKYSYRFLYLPETIGSILYLSRHGEGLKSGTAAGYVVTCVGHGGSYTYKKSRSGNTLADKAALHVLKQTGVPYREIDWSPIGSDERHYGSQAFDLPVGSLMRTAYDDYPEYHTSLDNRSLLSEVAMRQTVDLYLDVLMTIESNDKYQAAHVHGQPKLDPRALYPYGGGTRNEAQERLTAVYSYLLAFSDGRHDVIDIADKLNLTGKDMAEACSALEREGLLHPLSESAERAGAL